MCVLSDSVMNLDRLENHTHVRRRFPRYHTTLFRGQALWDPYTHVILPPAALVPQRQQQQHNWKERERTEKERENRCTNRNRKAEECQPLWESTHTDFFSLFQCRPLLTTLLHFLSVSQPIRRENTLRPNAPCRCPSRPSPLSSCWSIAVWEPPSLPSITRTDEEWGGNRSHSEQ